MRILLATNALVLVSGATLGPIYALFVDEIGGDLMDASIAGAIFAFVAGVVTFVSGKYADHVEENELIIVLGYIIMGSGYLLYAWVNSIIVLFVVQAIIGLGEAIYSPAFDAVYSKHLDDGRSGSQWGAWESMHYFAAAVGAVIGGAVVTWCGFSCLFFIMAALCFCSAFYIYQLKRDVL